MSAPDALGRLVLEALERIEGGAARDDVVEELAEAHPQEAAALRRRLDALERFGVLAPAPNDAPPERLGPFRLLEVLGGGGMGVVYLAEDAALGRRVALKIVHPALLLVPGARERFTREVETVAALQHPGIVPVFSVGEDDGVPYYTMPAVQGCTLAALLEEVSGRDPAELRGADLAAAIEARTPGANPGEAGGYVFDGDWERAVLLLARQVAEALHHAHEHGVLHRDVKPSNIMVGLDGRAMLLDFGLASTDTHASLTRSGSPLGSPPYMAPEQIRGELEHLDARTDVYALGVTLGELLTLRKVFDAGSPAATARAIQLGERAAPRSLNSALSWEAETVALTASDPEAARRYASSAELARDLVNVLERRPLEARRASFALRARRWVQRRPVLTLTAVLALVLLVLGPSVLAVQARAAAEELREEQAATRAQNARAERHRDAALAAIDAMLVRVADRDLRDIPQMVPLRRDLLDEAVAMHRALLATEGAEGAVVLAAARALVTAGKIHAELGELELAQQLQEEARDVLDELLAEQPGFAGAQEQRGSVLRNLAIQAAEQGDQTQAEELFESAVAIAEAEAADAADTTDTTDTADADAADATDATDTLTAGPATTEPVATPMSDADFMSQAQLALSLLNQGSSRWTREPDAGIADLERSIELLAELGRARPKHPAPPSNEAVAAGNLGAILGALGRKPQALLAHARSLAALERVLALEPANADARRQLGATHSNLAMDLPEERRDEALDHMRHALDVLEQLSADFPASQLYRNELARTRGNAAQLALFGGDLQGAADAWRSNAELQAALLAESPGNATLAYDLGVTRNNLSSTLRRLDLRAEAREVALQAVPFCEQLLLKTPEDPRRQLLFATACANLAYVLDEAERATAVGLLQHALTQFDKALSGEYDDPPAEAARELARTRLAEWTPASPDSSETP